LRKTDCGRSSLRRTFGAPSARNRASRPGYDGHFLLPCFIALRSDRHFENANLVIIKIHASIVHDHVYVYDYVKRKKLLRRFRLRANESRNDQVTAYVEGRAAHIQEAIDSENEGHAFPWDSHGLKQNQDQRQ